MSYVRLTSDAMKAANVKRADRMRKAWEYAKSLPIPLKRLTKECFGVQTPTTPKMEKEMIEFTKTQKIAVNLILDGEKFNGTVYGKRHNNKYLLHIYVGGKAYDIAVVEKSEVEEAKSSFLAKLQKLEICKLVPEDVEGGYMIDSVPATEKSARYLNPVVKELMEQKEDAFSQWARNEHNGYGND